MLVKEIEYKSSQKGYGLTFIGKDGERGLIGVFKTRLQAKEYGNSKKITGEIASPRVVLWTKANYNRFDCILKKMNKFIKKC